MATCEHVDDNNYILAFINPFNIGWLWKKWPTINKGSRVGYS